MKTSEFCYWCGKIATSKEHVPPKCLFPEMKDINGIYDKTFRINLITVPSCDEHNMEKSHEDEYLMACLSARVGNNGVAYVHTATKVKRARDRNPHLLNVVIDEKLNLSGKEYPIQWIKTENYKLAHSFEGIARALYFYGTKESFSGECKIISNIFIHPSDKKWSSFITRAVKLIESEQKHWGTEVKGDNADIFTYQFSPLDGYKSQTLALSFYKKTKVYALLGNKNQEELKKVKPKFESLFKAMFDDLP
jgi:hypothetical protein